MSEDPNAQSCEDVRAQHDGWVRANYVGDTDWLEKNVAPDGPDAFVFFNLSASNFFGLEATVDLWRKLRAAARKSNPSAGRARLDDSDVRVRANGDVAWVTYLARFRADLGEMAGKIDQLSRGTEIWERQQGAWKLVHVHASEHKPGEIGGS